MAPPTDAPGKDVLRLQDILDYGEVAAEIAAEGVAAVTDDVRLRLALERALFILGESASQLGAATRNAIDQPWPDIVGLRHVLAHRYDAVRPERLVVYASRDVPKLLQAIRRHLEKRA